MLLANSVEQRCWHMRRRSHLLYARVFAADKGKSDTGLAIHLTASLALTCTLLQHTQYDVDAVCLHCRIRCAPEIADVVRSCWVTCINGKLQLGTEPCVVPALARGACSVTSSSEHLQAFCKACAMLMWFCCGFRGCGQRRRQPHISRRTPLGESGMTYWCCHTLT